MNSPQKIWYREDPSALLSGKCLGRTPEQRSLSLDGRRRSSNLNIGVLPLLLLNRFAGRGQGFDTIVGVETWCVPHVLEPWPIRQARRVEKDAFALNKFKVQCGRGFQGRGGDRRGVIGRS